MELTANHIHKIVHHFPRVMANPRLWNEGEAAFDLMTGPWMLVWNLCKFLMHIVLMCLGIEADDRTPDEMPGYQDLDKKDHEYEKEHSDYYTDPAARAKFNSNN